MNSCLVPNSDAFIEEIVKLCDSAVNLDLREAHTTLHNGIKTMIERARSSAEPESQLKMLRDTLDELYASDDEYSNFFSELMPQGHVHVMFNTNYGQASDDKQPSQTGEAAKSRRITRSRNFLDSKFKGAPNAKLYFRRSIRNDMVETFLVKRSSGTPRYFTSQEEMNLNVKTYKQELLDRVFAFFDSDVHLKDRVKNLPRTFYDAQGNYTGVIEAIKAVIDSRLAPEMFEQSGVLPLDEFYRNYRGTDKSKRDRAKLMLDAYNGWVMLQNFDTIVSDVFGSIVKISPDDFNGHDSDLHKYKIADRATNMWNNWGDTDDIADMADVISDVTQSLVETSRMYKWESNEAYPDRYLSFNDFNFAVGWIKRLAFDPISDTIDLHDNTLTNLDKLSLDTKRILFDILNWNKENGNYKRDVNGNVLRDAKGNVYKIPREVTLKQLIARINENPQKYLHAIFDILTTTNILDKFNAGEYTKNIIWSLHKEIFGVTKGSEKNSRSLYNIHAQSEHDSVYQILTQVAASTFPEDYLQYYEKSDGVISTRLLQDYAIDSVKRSLFQDIQQTALALSPDMYARFGITPVVFKDNPKFLGELHVSVTLPSGFVYNIRTTPNEVYNDDLTPEQAKSIWESKQFQRIIKDILGIDFESDPDLKNAYIEVMKGTSNAVTDISNLLGRVLFSAVVNNSFTPGYKRASKNRKDLEEFLKKQYGDSDYGKYLSGVKDATGYIPVLPTNLKDAALGSIAMATAMNNSLLSAAQSKTGEGTSLANYVLSRMRNFYPNQIEMQCKKMNSATKDLSFVVNSNNLFEGILTRRELKTLSTNQQSTQFSDSQSFELSFIDDFIAGFIPDPDNNAYIKNGRVSFLPTVNSDKSQIDGLLVNLHAKTRIPNGRGGFKTYMELTDSEIEQEMVSEFKPMYDRIISNINNELSKIGIAIAGYNQLLIENGKTPLETQLVEFSDSDSVITKNQALLTFINDTFKDREDLGKKPKERIINGLHQVITHYNQTHRRNPIMLSEHVHYVFDAETGLLTSNKTLESLWGRFNPDTDIATKTKLAQLYAKEVGYQAYMKRNGLSDPTSVTSFFKYKEHLTVENLIKMGFKIPLWGSNAVVRHDQSEIQFLRGDAKFTAEQLKDPHYQQLAALSQDLGRNWVSRDGLMIIAKGYIDGVLTNITTLEQLNEATNLVIHPMLSKLNRLDYLCTQQYTISTVGSHYVHKGKGKPGQILVEEANRWLASNKRNVAATSTVHLFQNKQIDGVPSVYNIGIIEDVFFDLYSAMGDLYLEGHAPLDGGMFVNAWIPDLENNSLAGEAAGLDKKQFGTFYSELYGAGGIVKTAGFAATNARMRRQKAWVNLQRNMSSFKWIKENAGEDGSDIPEKSEHPNNYKGKSIDITKNYLGNDIDYKQAIKGEKILYKRPAHDNPSEMAAYEQLGIKSLGNNTYEISEIEINNSGVPIGAVQKRVEVIDNNWDLFTKVFGGQYSLELGPNGKLKWSENSNKLMVHAINNIGYRKDNSRTLSEDFGQLGDSEAIEKHVNSVKTGLDQDDIWQPLKYSDLHYIPNIGAIKSLQFNVNPNGEAVLESYVPMNFMVMRLAQLGIQLDKEHHADMSEVSMPTQIIQACANRSFTSEYAREIYTALETLTRQATQPFLDGIKDIITSEDPTKLSEEVTKLIVDNLLHQSGDDNSVNAILKQLLEKAERGETIKFAEDVKGKLPWSDPTISNKLFSSLSTTLTNIAVKMKFPGSLSVICPTERVEKIYGNSLLDSFTRITNPDGSTRTKSPEDALKDYQKRVIAGEEIDASGNNMLIYDEGRDLSIPDEDVINLEEEPSLDKTHDILVKNLQYANSFVKLMEVSESELSEVLTQALQRVGFEVYESSLQYAQNVINEIKKLGVSHEDVLSARAIKDCKELGIPESLLPEIESIRQLLLKKEDATAVLPYKTYKQYENLIERATDLIDGKEYNKNKKGYEVTPSGLEALNRIIKLFGEITDFGALNTLWSVLHVDAPIKITPNVNILTLISSGYLKPKGSTFLKNTIRRKKLSAVAKLKPQHNYIIEYTDGSTDNFTFNTPVSYRELKNIVCFGKKGNPDLLPPLNYEQLLEEKINQVRVDDVDPRIEVLYSYFKTPRLLQSSVMRETGFGKEEIKRLFGIFASKEKGGLTTHELAELIYADHDDIFKDDIEVHDLLLDALSSARTKGDLIHYENHVIENEARKLADAEYSEYASLLYENMKMTPEEYEVYYREHGVDKQVARIYENVEEGRALGAYNARFQDEYGNHFNMFDLDSMVLLFDLNGLWTSKDRPIKGYKLFQNLTLEEQQEVLNKVFASTAFDKEGVYQYLKQKYAIIPKFDKDFMSKLVGLCLNADGSINNNRVISIITDLHKVAKVSAHKILQNDLFKLSDNYTGTDRRIYANRTLIKPTNIEVDAYETILPQIYQTVFGLQEGDIVEDILKDKDFFIKRGLDRFACKLDHSDYDYELKNFNGEHIYIIDRSHGIPNHLQGLPIFTETRNGKHYRLDSDGNVLYEMASEHDDVCKVGNVQVIVTDDPMFYINSMNYNTLKVSPKRVTQESYDSLVENLKDSKRTNSQNFMKAITIGEGSVMDLKTFKDFNTAIDNITYENVKKTEGGKDFKSVAQICNILLKNGRELHVSFEQSLEMVAGRIPAQSQQSFMIQRVIGFDSSGLNTAMVSTFQLFLQGSDLDIDAVTMLGYEFDHNGKFVGWSPYFKIDTKEKLKASKKMPLPTGQKSEINVSPKAPNNFFEVYDKYFGTLFQTIKLPTGEDNFKTKDGALELQMVYDTPEGLELLAQFLRDFNEYGVNIQGEAVESESGVLIKTENENLFYKTDSEGNVVGEWNLFMHKTAGGEIGARPDQVYAMAEQILKFANDHNDYLNTAKEHLKDKMAKNYVVHYIYKVAEALCNQTESQVGLDVSTSDVKKAAANSPMANASNSYAPGGAEVKHKSVGEGQVGKSCVGIGAVGIKANSTTQFYISEILNYGSDWDREKIMFKRPITIGGVTYSGFANMHTSKQFSERDMANVQAALEYINALEHPDQLTPDVAVNIASLLSIAVDNAKDLALAKINSGPKMMGLYAYGLTLGIPINDLVDIINSEEGRILTELTEGSYFNNDTTAFKVLDAIKKLDGNVMGDLDKYSYVSRNDQGNVVKVRTTITIDGKVQEIASTHEALFTLMYDAYARWFNSVKEQPWFKRSVSKNPVLATSFSGMLRHLLLGNAFKDVFNSSKYLIEGFINKHINVSAKASDATNWIASLYQMVSYLEDMQTKISKFKSSKGRDLRKLAQGAEEMRILGSILSINKGLKATASEAEAFIDTIENLIYDRKNVLGMKVSEDDKLDFIRFMTDEEYQKQKIDEYDKIKHSVNILHLISKVPHFNGYLKTQMIPNAFFMTSSIKYRTIHKFRRNINADKPGTNKVIPLFNLFEVSGTKEKESILRGLENLVHYKMFTRWAYDQRLQFKVPAGFKYFTKRNELVSNPNGETVIDLWTQHGMATFKKYMEEVYIPMLKDSSVSDNPFIVGLRKISYDKTPVHNSVTAYSLPGDLMSKKGSQGEINAHTFASFQNLDRIVFQEDSKIYSLHDAFYIYAQYCYMGRKGQKSLMSLFDNETSRKGLAKSFTEHIAKMDVDGNITCSKSELIAWCAPYGGQYLNSKYGYVTSKEEFGVSLKRKREDASRIKEDPDNPSDVDPSDVESVSVEDVGGYVSAKKPENFRTYQEQYLSSQYDRQTLNHFLVPISEGEGSYTTFYPNANIAGITTDIDLTINHDMIQEITFNEEFATTFEEKIADGTIIKFKSFEEFKEALMKELKPLHIPYKVALYANSKREINFGILQSLINNLINC